MKKISAKSEKLFWEGRGSFHVSPLSPAEMREIESNFSLPPCPSRKDISGLPTNLSSKYREIRQKENIITRVMVYNGRLITAVSGTLDFLKIF